MSHAAHPAAPRSPAEQRRLEAGLRELFEQRIAFNEVLGLRIDGLDPHAPLIRFAMRPALIGHFVYGRLHGGAIAAALDATAGFALLLALADKHLEEPLEQLLARFARMGTIDLRIDFLRPGVGREFAASARVTRLGGRIASVQMSLNNDEQTLIATGAASYVIS